MNTPNSLWLSRPQQLHLLLTEAKYDLLTLWRTPGFVAPSLIFPVMFYLLFGVFLTKGGQSDYLLVTYCCFGVMGPALFNFGVNVASEKSQGWLTMKQIAPAPVSAYLFGKMVSSLLFALVIVVLLFVVAALFGQVRLYTSQWLGLAGLVLLGTIPFCLFGLWLGLTISAKAAPAVVNLIYLPMAFLGGLWLPIQLLPVSLQHFAQLLPSFHFGQLALGIINRALPQPWWQHLLALLLFTLLFAFLTTRAFRHNRSA
ncbi:MAG: ABC transporter permease [Gammaproteobacteria bacterium]|jgi:ABC-2 type transport system permease protein|nr:ABC transporter permease [Gammaproteobacteria bacterium]